MKHVIPPNGCAGGSTGGTGDIWINPGQPGRPSACRPATPTIRCKTGDVFRLDTPGGGGHGDPLDARSRARARRRARGHVSAEAAERDYGVVLQAIGAAWALDEAATQARRAQMPRPAGQAMNRTRFDG